MSKVFSIKTSVVVSSENVTESPSSYGTYGSMVYLISSSSPFALSDSIENPNLNKSLNYLWENYSENFSLLQYYNEIKNYERKYGFPSKDLFEQWKRGTALFRDIYINDWLNKYLQIKDFIQ